MRRREFIAGLGGAAWPWWGAQQASMPVVGFVSRQVPGRQESRSIDPYEPVLAACQLLEDSFGFPQNTLEGLVRVALIRRLNDFPPTRVELVLQMFADARPEQDRGDVTGGEEFHEGW